MEFCIEPTISYTMSDGKLQYYKMLVGVNSKGIKLTSCQKCYCTVCHCSKLLIPIDSFIFLPKYSSLQLKKKYFGPVILYFIQWFGLV